jgi:Tol biopolymer transport system component
MKLCPPHVLGAVALTAATVFTAACDGDTLPTQPGEPAPRAAEAHAGDPVAFKLPPTVTGRIAFASSRDGDHDIYTINPDGTGLVQVTGGDEAESSWEMFPAWDRKQKLSFATDRNIENDNSNLEIYAISANGSGETRLTDDPAQDLTSAWSPNGSRVAFTSERGGTPDVWVMHGDGTGLAQLTSAVAYDGDPTWSPDGKRIAFVSSRGDTDMEIWVMNADGSNQHQITRNSALDAYPHWSPDGQWIAFTSDRDGNLEIYRMRPDGTGTIRLTNNPAQDFDPSWSPDGSQIAFTTNRPGNQEIYLMWSDGTHLFNLTQHPGTDAAPTWSR